MRALLALVLVLAAGFAAAVEPGERLNDPALEARARAISAELRCVVCQNEPIDASNAEIARDMRRIVRERIAADDSDTEVKAFMVARYGDFVLFRPPVRPTTWLLWAGPFLVLALGALAAAAYLMARARTASTAPSLSPDEERRLAELLSDRGRDPG